MKYEKKILISQKEADHINWLFNMANEMGEDDTISHTAKFDNGIEVDVKLCGVDDGYPWTEAVMFKNGSEVCCTEVCEEYLGEWEFEYNGDQYIVYVEVM